MTDPGDLRASDADRETVVRALTEQMGVGRLTMTEFDERCRSVYAAKTYADLVPITADLPLPSPLVSPPGWVGAGSVPRQAGSRPTMPNPRTGQADDDREPLQYGVPRTVGEPTEVVGRGTRHPEDDGRHYPFGWRSALSGYLMVSLILVGIWFATGARGHFWPAWFLFFGLFGVFGGGRHGHRRGCR